MVPRNGHYYSLTKNLNESPDITANKTRVKEISNAFSNKLNSGYIVVNYCNIIFIRKKTDKLKKNMYPIWMTSIFIKLILVKFKK